MAQLPSPRTTAKTPRERASHSNAWLTAEAAKLNRVNSSGLVGAVAAPVASWRAGQALVTGAAVFRLMGPASAAEDVPLPMSFWAISREISPWVVMLCDSTAILAESGA